MENLWTKSKKLSMKEHSLISSKLLRLFPLALSKMIFPSNLTPLRHGFNFVLFWKAILIKQQPGNLSNSWLISTRRALWNLLVSWSKKNTSMEEFLEKSNKSKIGHVTCSIYGCQPLSLRFSHLSITCMRICHRVGTQSSTSSTMFSNMLLKLVPKKMQK